MQKRKAGGRRRAPISSSFKRARPVGRTDLRHPDVAASFAHDITELEKRLADAEAEVAPCRGALQGLRREAPALFTLVESCLRWAAAQSPPITLPATTLTWACPALRRPLCTSRNQRRGHGHDDD